jgi:hypothetical protein
MVSWLDYKTRLATPLKARDDSLRPQRLGLRLAGKRVPCSATIGRGGCTSSGTAPPKGTVRVRQAVAFGNLAVAGCMKDYVIKGNTLLERSGRVLGSSGASSHKTSPRLGVAVRL